MSFLFMRGEIVLRWQESSCFPQSIALQPGFNLPLCSPGWSSMLFERRCRQNFTRKHEACYSLLLICIIHRLAGIR
ncbi:hypothetical protein GQ53DRAFT_80678 [Thozetella sp. PMI_491]|nr:hypothetical protein GQ53DRAFT_80678 [Thozetella sp. PMI_491]